MIQNFIEVYKDKKLMDLIEKSHALEAEEIEFLLSDITTNEKGRTRNEVSKEKIALLEDINNYFKSHYPNNKVADNYIATNQFIINRLKEDIIN